MSDNNDCGNEVYLARYVSTRALLGQVRQTLNLRTAKAIGFTFPPGFTHKRSKIENDARSINFRASSALRKAGCIARIGGTGAMTSDLSRLTRYGRRLGVREP